MSFSCVHLRDWEDIITLSKEPAVHHVSIRTQRARSEIVKEEYAPCKGQLARSGVLFLGNLIDLVDKLEVLWEVLSAEARRVLPEVTLFEIGWATNLSAKHTTT